MERIIIGIDPGLSGALAVLDGGRLVDAIDMPVVEIVRNSKRKREIDPAALASILRPLAGSVAVLERVGAMPKQGVSSMFAFGRSVGMVEGALAALAIPVHYVTPQTWLKAMAVPGGDGGGRLRASQLFPGDVDRWRRVKDDGRADAVLIAAFGARHLFAPEVAAA